MTNREINWTIAEHLGWKVFQIDFAYRSWINMYPPGSDEANLNTEAHQELTWEEFRLLQERDGMAIPIHETCPDYTEDYNAIIPVIRKLAGDLDLRFMKLLCATVGHEFEDPVHSRLALLAATPREMSEVFLMAVGKWRKE